MTLLCFLSINKVRGQTQKEKHVDNYLSRRVIYTINDQEVPVCIDSVKLEYINSEKLKINYPIKVELCPKIGTPVNVEPYDSFVVSTLIARDEISCKDVEVILNWDSKNRITRLIIIKDNITLNLSNLSKL